MPYNGSKEPQNYSETLLSINSLYFNLRKISYFLYLYLFLYLELGALLRDLLIGLFISFPIHKGYKNYICISSALQLN